MKTVLQILRTTKKALLDGGVENAENEAQWLIEKVYNTDKVTLMTKRVMSGEDSEIVLDALVKRRIAGEPLQYLLGEWDFMGIKVDVGQGVLIPREDTFAVISSTFDYLDKLCERLESGEKVRILDLCSGSGIIALYLEKRYRKAEIYALEKDKAAFAYLERNIAKNDSHITPVLGDVFESFVNYEDGFFDLIISNPPYVKTSELDSLQKEVLYEPKAALDGGEDGCDFYKAIVKLWSQKLKDGGMLSFELSEEQFDDVAQLMRQKGFKRIKAYFDLSGVRRAINAVLNTQDLQEASAYTV